MKIALYDPYLDTMSGGEKYMLSIALCLIDNHEVSIMWDKTPPEVIAQQAKKRFNFDFSKLTFAKNAFDPRIGLKERYSLTKAYDLIIVLSDGSIPLVTCPLILHFQSPMPWINGHTFKNKLKLSRVKKIIVNSKFTKEHIDKSLGRKTSILYPPVVIQRVFDPKKKTNTILNVGRFGINQAGSSFKKQDILADAFVKMVDDGLKEWELIFVMSYLDQDQEAMDSFKNKYKNYPIKIRINTTNSELWDLYECSSIYWHASGFGEDLRNHPDRAEHFGISTVEAMGVGAVPVVINAGGQKEIVEDHKNGRLWSSQEELISITRELMNDRAMRSILSEQAVKDAKKYDEKRFCDEVNKLML